MKKPINSTLPPAFGSHLASHRTHQILGGMLLSTAMAHADVALTFDTDTQGATAGGNATSMEWDSYGGGCLALTVGTNWKPEGVLINLNDASRTESPGPAPASLEALRSELKLAISNGGTMSYKITVETDAFAPSGPFPQWFQTIYQGRSWGQDQALGTAQGQLEIGFGGAPLTNKVEYFVSYPIEASSTNVNDARAQFNSAANQFEIYLGLNTGSNTETLVGTVRFYIDDFKIAANVVEAPVEIPNLTITPAVPGLNLIASTSGAYDRQTVRTSDGIDATWVGGTYPKTYEITVADSPKTNYETFINFVPGTASPNSFAQYSEPNCFGVWISSDVNGGGTASVRYKNGFPGSNGPSGREFWVPETAPSDGVGGQIVNKYSAQMQGTWKITFTSDTDFTITVPDGTSVSGALNPSFAAKFANSDPEETPNPTVVYFGNTPTSAANVGLTAVHSAIKITGTSYPIDEKLATDAMDTANLKSVTTSIVQVLPDIAKYWIHWSLPATGFELMQSTDLGVIDPWTSLPTNTALASKFGKSRLLLESEVTSLETDFFRMVKAGTVSP